jgi:hypothetical protein
MPIPRRDNPSLRLIRDLDIDDWDPGDWGEAFLGGRHTPEGVRVEYAPLHKNRYPDRQYDR